MGPSTLLSGPVQIYRRHNSTVAVGRFRYIDIAASVGPFRNIDTGIWWWLWAHSGMLMLLGGPIQDYRCRYLALAMGPFRYIDIAASVGPFKIIDRLFGAGHPKKPRIIDNIAIAHLKNCQ
jgi:hypothetical protein